MRSRFERCLEKLIGGSFDISTGNFERLGDTFDGHRPDEFRVAFDKRGYVRWIRGFADVIGDIF